MLMITVLYLALAGGDPAEAARTAEEIIRSYVEDFRSDRFAAEPRLFGIEVVGEGTWHVRVTGEKEGDRWDVRLAEGPAPEPTFLYRVEPETLRAVERGELNALTAQGKSRLARRRTADL